MTESENLLKRQISSETSMTSSENPVATVLKGEAKTIDDLFNMDPEHLSDGDIDRIIHELRTRRAEWEREEAEKNAKGKSRTAPSAGAPQKKVGQKSLKEIDLDELGL